MLREHQETFWMWPATRGEVIGELRESGFAPLPEWAAPSVLAVRAVRATRAVSQPG